MGVLKRPSSLLGDVPDLVPQAGDLLREFVPIGECSVPLGDELAVARLDPGESSLLALEGPVGGGEVLAELANCSACLVELDTESTPDLQRPCELITVLEGLLEYGRLGHALLSRAECSGAIGVGAPLAWPTALARDCHRESA